MDLISIIVPVYNVEKYIKECVDSLLNQSYSNLEIILIDDGSTDSSGSICDEYLLIDNRIKVFHKINGGLSEARNYGIDRMTGKYVTFVDSDDFLSVYAIEILYKSAQIYQSDLVCTIKAVRFEIAKFVEFERPKEIDEIVTKYSQNEILRYAFYQKTNITGAPGKLYIAELFNKMKIRFPYGVYFEDLATMYQFVLHSNHITMVNSRIYAYRMRKEGIIHQKFSEKKLTCINVTRKLFKDILEQRPELKNAAASRCCSCNRMVYSQIPYQMKKERNQVWQEIRKYRDIVIKDSKARKRERISCMISYLGQPLFYCFNKFSLYCKYNIINR